MLVNIVPILPVASDRFQDTLTFFRQVLQFSDDIVTEDYVTLKKDNVTIAVAKSDSTVNPTLLKSVAEYTAFRLQLIDRESLQSYYNHIDGLISSYSGSNLIAMKEMPWGTLEMTVIDQNGFCYTFFAK
jgi:hypothetical protein